MTRTLKDELYDFRVAEKLAPVGYQNEKLVGVRVSKPIKASLTKLAMMHGVSEAQLGRFLVLEGLKAFGIDPHKR